MVGGMFATPQSDGAIVSYDFIDQLYSHEGIADVVDVVGIHPYSPDVGGVIDQLDGTREAIDDAGRRRLDLDHRARLVIRPEGARPIRRRRRSSRRTCSARASRRCPSSATSGRSREPSGSPGATTRGPVGECVWCEFAGLVDTDRDTKPAWEAFTELTGGTP